MWWLWTSPASDDTLSSKAGEVQVKTAALKATCVLRHHGTALARGKEGQANDEISLAPDGQTYELEEHPKIRAVP
jgi:hypothetical protein